MEGGLDINDLAAEGWNPFSAAREPKIDLQRYVAILRRRAAVLVTVFLVVAVGIWVLGLLPRPRYMATAQVMLDQRQSRVATIQQVGSTLPPESAAVDTEVEVLKSRGLAEKVVSKLSLVNDPEFNPAARRVSLHSEHPAPSPALGQAGSSLMSQSFEDVVDHVLKRLKVSRSGLTYVMDVSFESTSPAKAAQIANAFADQYLLEQLDAKFDAARRASAWLDSRLAGLRAQAAGSDAAARQFAAANGLIGIQTAQGATITQQEISNLDVQLAAAQEAESEATANYVTSREQASNGNGGGDLGGALNSPVIQALRNRRADITRQIAEMSVRLGPRYPDVISEKTQLADVDNQIKSEIGRIQSNLAAQVQITRQRVASINGSLSHSKAALFTSNAAATQLGQLQSRAQADAAVYQSFLDSFKQTSAQQGIDQSDARVVSYARDPRAPSFPNMSLVLAVALVAGLTAALGTVAVLEGLENGVSTADDVEAQFGLPHLTSIPRLNQSIDYNRRQGRSSPIDYIIKHQYSSLAEAYRQLATTIFLTPAPLPTKVLAVTSALPSEGKTMTSLCLARTLAVSGMSVVVLDCDLRRRSLLLHLKQSAKVGLVEVLNGQATLDDALITDEASGAAILPAAKSSGFVSPTLLGGPTMAALLMQLRARYDVVIMDTPPVIAVADTKVLVSQADTVLFLARWRKTPNKAIQHSLKEIKILGVRIAGVAMTLVDARAQAKTGYGDPQYYLRAFNNYYTPPDVVHQNAFSL